MADLLEIRIDGCAGSAYNLSRKEVKLRLYVETTAPTRTKVDVAELTMPESGAIEILYKLMNALGPEVMMRELSLAMQKDGSGPAH